MVDVADLWRRVIRKGRLCPGSPESLVSCSILYGTVRTTVYSSFIQLYLAPYRGRDIVRFLLCLCSFYFNGLMARLLIVWRFVLSPQ